MPTREFPKNDWLTGAPGPDVDAAQMDAAIAEISTNPSEFGTNLALIVVHRGRIVREIYGEGVTAQSTLISWSIAKSITHALVGIAVKDGVLSISDRNLFPHWQDERAGITLGNLLNMSSGLSWREDYVNDSISDVIEMLFGEGEFAGDHSRYASAKELEAKPGSKYMYSSGTTNLVTRILAVALGEKNGSSETVERFMRQRLFEPIGIHSAIPKFDDTGNFVGSSFVYAFARDFARFGYLYLNDGMWGEKRLLPEGWVQYGRTSIALDPENGLEYGAHWWMSPEDPGSMTAMGYEGQFTWISPDRDLVLVRLGKTDNELVPELRGKWVEIIRAFPADGSEIGNDSTHG
jgi:CubicO group peptidase (beta-lactamase class C family)